MGMLKKEVSVGRYTQVQPTVPQLSVKSSCINTTKKNMYLGGRPAICCPSHTLPCWPCLMGQLLCGLMWGQAGQKEGKEPMYICVWVGVADGSVLYLY